MTIFAIYFVSISTLVEISSLQHHVKHYLKVFNVSGKREKILLRRFNDLSLSYVKQQQPLPISTSSSVCGNAHAKSRRFVAGSMACYGAHLCNGAEYHGKYDLPHSVPTDDYLCQWHRHNLINASPDVITFETIPCLTEVKGVLKLLIESGSETTAWLDLHRMSIKSSWRRDWRLLSIDRRSFRQLSLIFRAS